MTQQRLDDADVDLLFQQMGGEAMPQSAAFSRAFARLTAFNDPNPISRDRPLSMNLYNQDLAPDLDT